MAATLQLDHSARVLEVGTGSGYAAAVLSRLAGEVYTIERVPDLAKSASQRLKSLGYTNVQVIAGDGTLGMQDHAPFDAISVAAGAAHVPDSLFAQLSKGGRLVMPVGADGSQKLIRFKLAERGDFKREELCAVRFVPLIGQRFHED